MVFNNRITIQYGYISNKKAGNTITYPISFSSIGMPVVTLHFSNHVSGNTKFQLHIYNNIKSSFQIGTVNSSEDIFSTWIACGT